MGLVERLRQTSHFDRELPPRKLFSLGGHIHVIRLVAGGRDSPSGQKLRELSLGEPVNETRAQQATLASLNQ
jgi:hypothetical protein